MAATIILVFCGLLLIGLGWLVDKKQMYGLISGYNMMNKERKKQVDVRGLASFLAKHLYFMAFLFLLAGLFISLNMEYVTFALIILIFPQTMHLIFKAQSFDKGAKNEDGSYKISTKLIMGFMIVVFIGIILLLVASILPAELIAGDQSFTIKGIYGKEILYKDIDQIWLADTRPGIKTRNNGTSLGDIRKGRFTLDDDRRGALLFLEPDVPPYLFIITDRERVIISRENSDQLEALYQKLQENIQ